MVYYRNQRSNFQRGRQQQANFIDPSMIGHAIGGMDVGEQLRGLQQAGAHAMGSPGAYIDAGRDAFNSLRGGAGQAFDAVRQGGMGLGSGIMDAGRDLYSSVPDMVAGKAGQIGSQIGDAFQQFRGMPMAAQGTIAAGVGGAGTMAAQLGTRGLRAKRAAAAAGGALPQVAQVPGRMQQARAFVGRNRNPLLAGAGALGALGAGGAYLANRGQADMSHRVNSIASFASDPANLAYFNQYRR